MVLGSAFVEDQGFAFSSEIQLNIPIPGFTIPRSGIPSSFMRISPQIRQEPQKMEGPKDFSYFCCYLGGIEELSLGEFLFNRTFCPSAYSLNEHFQDPVNKPFSFTNASWGWGILGASISFLDHRFGKLQHEIISFFSFGCC